MKLTDFFTSDKAVSNSASKTQQNTTVKSDVINRQIRAMIPGQTIQGEVVSRNGSEVQIRLSEDLTLQAKLDQNMNLEVGKNMTFEVKNNGKALVLSPLFTNVATDANVMKALDMASLPVNGSTVALTKQLMEAGLSVDRNTLQQVYREVNMFPEAPSSDIVNLHKMQMPVNRDNVTQMSSYRNLTHQLVTGMNNVLDAVPEMFSQMITSGDTEGAVKLYQQLVLMAQEGAVELTGGASLNTVLTNGAITESTVINGEGQTGNLPSEISGNGGNQNTTQTVLPDGNLVQTDQLPISDNSLNIAGQGNAEQNNATAGVLQQAVNQTQSQSVDALLEVLVNAAKGENVDNVVINNSAESDAGLTGNISTISTNGAVLAENQTPTQQLQTLLAQLPTDISDLNMSDILQKMLQKGDDGKELLEPLMKLLKQQWTITPEQVADADQVENLYRRLDKHMKNFARVMENAGQSNTPAHNAVTNLSQNIDFLQQVNQMYTYVQLPLRLQNGEAHGDLYVYTNKKHLAAKDGQISALLHLDMEHLGPVDVYVAMQSEKVNTKFYMQDEEMLDFMMEHIDILTKRLQKRGYQCSFEMQVRDRGQEEKSAIETLLNQEKQVPLAEYAFDVRT